MSRNILSIYYAATVIFIALDYAGGLNIRAAFLEQAPGWRAVFYAFLLGCFALTVWRPAWATLVGTIESGITLAALILNMGLRTFVVTDQMIESGAGAVTMQEVVNFIIVGGAAYVSYTLGIRQLANRRGFD